LKRILVLAYTVYSTDGRVKRHAEAFAQRGDLVDVICLQEQYRAHDGPVNVIRLPVVRYRGNSRQRYLSSYLAFFSRATALAVRLSRVHSYDAVVACTLPDFAIFSALPLRWFGSRIVLDMHDTMPELFADKFPGRRGEAGARILKLGERLCAALADRVLAVHELHAERLANVGVSAAKIRVVVNSPDPAIFKRYPIYHGAAGFSLVCHGTLTRRLGLDTALHALAMLRKRMPDGPQLTIIGEGDHRHALETLVKSLNLQSSVRFKSGIPMHALPAELASATIGLAPYQASAATSLMLPVKLLEYAALGIPTVSARLRAVVRYFGDDALEYFEPGDSVGLADAIERLYRDPGRRASMIDRASEIACELGWSEQRANLFEAIDSILGSGVPAKRPGAEPIQCEEDSRASAGS
jgi:glycosyltransferase involved in cell wall biosynthesis